MFDFLKPRRTRSSRLVSPKPEWDVPAAWRSAEGHEVRQGSDGRRLMRIYEMTTPR